MRLLKHVVELSCCAFILSFDKENDFALMKDVKLEEDDWDVEG